MPNVSIADGMIQFRHPRVFSGKYGKPIRKSVARHSFAVQGQIQEDCQTLVDAAPRTLAEAPKRPDGEPLHSEALRFYFEPIGKRSWLDKLQEISPELMEEMGVQLEGEENIELWRAQNEIRDLKAFIAEMTKSSGVRAKAEKETPLADCVEHFEKKFRVKGNPEQRDEVIRRVKTVAGLIGLEKKYSEVTLHSIEDAVAAGKSREKEMSEGETFKRKQHIKRFFKFLCLPANEGGMGFATNPAANMYVGSVGAIQRRKVQRDGIDIADPAEWLSLENLSPFHRAAFAVLGYGGLRLSEMAGLFWTDIDFKARIIRIQPNEIRPGIKTTDSKRLVKPFANVWEELEEWRKTNPDNLAFPRASDKRRATDPLHGTWFALYKGKPRVEALSHFLSDELKRRGAKEYNKPQLRLRHFWSTTMEEKGYGALESIMGGHSKQTAAAYYQERERLVKAAKIGSI